MYPYLTIGALILEILVLVPKSTNAEGKCVWATGKFVCHQDPSAVDGVEVRMWDWDGGIFIDPDDKMGYQISDPNGEFRVEGCADDMFPWNQPDPYLAIFHHCGNPVGTTIETAIRRIFVPDIMDFGIIELDEKPGNITK